MKYNTDVEIKYSISLCCQVAELNDGSMVLFGISE